MKHRTIYSNGSCIDVAEIDLQRAKCSYSSRPRPCTITRPTLGVRGKKINLHHLSALKSKIGCNYRLKPPTHPSRPLLYNQASTKKSATPIGPEPFAKRTRLFTHSLKSPWSSLSPSPSSSKYPSSSLAIPPVSPQSPASDHPAPPTHHCGNHL